MSWNYRVCKETYKPGTPQEEVSFEIKEVYYNKSGEIWAVSENGASVYGETPDEVNEVLEKMNRATNKEVIDLDTLVFAKRD